jgi:hypothetical protein
MPNLLALFDAIRKRIDTPNDETIVEEALYQLALSTGMSFDDIESALHSQRWLTIYEP